jgi:hypothetical protein
MTEQSRWSLERPGQHAKRTHDTATEAALEDPQAQHHHSNSRHTTGKNLVGARLHLLDQASTWATHNSNVLLSATTSATGKLGTAATAACTSQPHVPTCQQIGRMHSATHAVHLREHQGTDRVHGPNPGLTHHCRTTPCTCPDQLPALPQRHQAHLQQLLLQQGPSAAQMARLQLHSTLHTPVTKEVASMPVPAAAILHPIHHVLHNSQVKQLAHSPPPPPNPAAPAHLPGFCCAARPPPQQPAFHNNCSGAPGLHNCSNQQHPQHPTGPRLSANSHPPTHRCGHCPSLYRCCPSHAQHLLHPTTAHSVHRPSSTQPLRHLCVEPPPFRRCTQCAWSHRHPALQPQSSSTWAATSSQTTPQAKPPPPPPPSHSPSPHHPAPRQADAVHPEHHLCRFPITLYMGHHHTVPPSPLTA